MEFQIKLENRWYNPYFFNNKIIMNQNTFDKFKEILEFKFEEDNIKYCSEFNIIIDNLLKDNEFIGPRINKNE